jgi:hypothetical protein
LSFLAVRLFLVAGLMLAYTTISVPSFSEELYYLPVVYQIVTIALGADQAALSPDNRYFPVARPAFGCHTARRLSRAKANTRKSIRIPMT